MRLIEINDTVLLQLPNEDTRSVKIDIKANANFGKYGTFPVKELVGKPYGYTFEIVDKKLHALPPQTIEDLDDTEANNELIVDGSSAQPLTQSEIEELKKSGAHVTDMIAAQIAQHGNYELKTEYSKDKYKKRKEAKYAKKITAIEPTLFNVCSYWFIKDPSRVRDIRPDTLAQMMTLANVRPGARYIVVDDAGGLVIAAVMERLGGQGKVMAISDSSQAAAYPCLAAMNFPRHQIDTFINTLNWAHTEENWAPIHDHAEAEAEGGGEDGTPEAGEEPGANRQRKLDRESVRVQRRRLVAVTLQTHREELFAGEWDGLIIASQYEPWSIVEKVYPYLAGSASIIVQSPYLQALTDVQTKMKATSGFLGPQVSETWTRKYQVLPGRTHPMMSTSGSGGHLLQAIKIYDSVVAQSTLVQERRVQRQKAAEAKRRKKAAEDSALAAGPSTSVPMGLSVSTPTPGDPMELDEV